MLASTINTGIIVPFKNIVTIHNYTFVRNRNIFIELDYRGHRIGG
jgi:hypothetical protein